MKKILIVLSTILLFISCENNNRGSIVTLDKLEDRKSELDDNKKEEGFIGTVNDSETSPQEIGREKAKQTQQKIVVEPDWDKRIIKTATLNLEVKDYNAYNSSLREKIKQTGGYVAQEQQTQSEYKIENAITIKVPVDQFDNAVDLITVSVKDLTEMKIASQDVTTEVVDTKSRLEAKKQVRLKYLDLLKQAKNMEEILNVQSEINRIQEEIESAAGRIEYLSHSSSFSTINLTFYQVLNEAAIDADRPSFAMRFTNAFQFGWTWIGELSIGIVSIWPLLLLVFTVFIFYKRSRRPKPKQA